MIQDDILLLSNDEETFLKSVYGCEDDRYSPINNRQLIMLLREKDVQLQKIRYQLVQKQKQITVSILAVFIDE